MQRTREWLCRFCFLTTIGAFIFVLAPQRVFARPEESAVGKDSFPFTEDELNAHVLALAKAYFRDFRHPETHVLYGARLATRHRWTSPADVKNEKPFPWGYGSRIADTSLHCGHMLVALLDAYEARPDPFLRENIRKTFAAIKLIGSLPETDPKPGKPALSGLVPRGPHPDDSSAWYDDSSMDQHTTYIIGLARYANSPLASDDEKIWIRGSLERVGRRLEKNAWSIKRADGVTQAHVGFAWTGFNSQHASILLPAVYALYKGTDDQHWLETFESFLSEKDGLRWQQLHAGPHIRLNAHPIYANQGSFRLNFLYRFQENPARKRVLQELLSYVAKLQMERDFPGPMYRRFHTDQAWRALRQKWQWNDDQLHGGEEAWSKFQAGMLDGDALAVLAHVRFPLAGYHMILMSDNRALIQAHLPAIWKMLTTVDLKKVSAGETNYLFTVAALYVYAHYYQQQKHSAAEEEGSSARDEPHINGPVRSLPIVAGARIGPTIDVTVDGDRAYAIGRGALHILDISNPLEPRRLGELSGLGNTRQIVHRRGIAYVGSREDGVFIIDVRQDDAPRLLAHYDSVEFATGVFVSGDVLFVACRHYGVELVDIATPARPVHLSTVRTGEAQSVVVRDGFLYAGVWATSEVVVVDVHNPWQPRVTAKVPLDGFGDGLDVRGTYLYAATGHHSRASHRTPESPGFGRGHGLEIFDIGQPGKPAFVGRVKFPPFYAMGNDLWSVSVVDGVAFVADTHNGMFVVDVADARRPCIIGRCELPNVKGRELPSFVGAVAPIKDYVLVAGGWSDLHIVAAKNIADHPAIVSGLPLSIPPKPEAEDEDRYRVYRVDGQVHAVELVGEKAVVACGSDGVHIVRLWPAITRLSALGTRGFATDVSVQGTQVYVAEGKGGLSICTLSGQDALIPVGRYRSEHGAVRQVEVPAPGRYALIQAGASTLELLDIRDPTSPKRVLVAKQIGLLYGDQLMRGLIDDRYAAAFWHVSGIYWFDLGDRSTSAPKYRGDHHPERFGASNGLVARGTKTLVTTRAGYVLLDRHERRPFKELPNYRLGKQRHHLGKPVIHGDRLVAANRSTGLITVADISNPERPELIEQFKTPGHPGRICVHDGNLVIPDGYHGLLVFDR